MSNDKKTISLTVQVEVPDALSEEQIADQVERLLGGSNLSDLKEGDFKSIGELKITTVPKIETSRNAAGYESRAIEWSRATCG